MTPVLKLSLFTNRPLGIALRSNPDQILGIVGCYWISEKHQIMELGYALAETHWGSGYATEAARALVRHCFQHFPVNRIQAHCTPENVSSARVLEKIGMQREGTIQDSVFRRGRFWNRSLYALLKRNACGGDHPH